MRQGTLKLKRLIAATFRVFFLFPSSCIFYRSEILSVLWLLVSLKTVNDYQKNTSCSAASVMIVLIWKSVC